MPEQGTAKFREITFENGVKIVTGARVTRATVAADYPNVPVGTLYISRLPNGQTARSYQKVTHTGAGVSTDWEKTTTSAAD